MKDAIRSWIDKLLTVRSDDAELVRRGRLLGILLLGTISATVVVSTVHSFDFVLSGFSRTALVHLFIDLAAFAILVGMLRLNQIGRTTLASYMALFLLIASAPAFESRDFNRLALLYIIATGAASFFIQPRASFVCAALSGLSYTLVFIMTHSTGYNYFLVVGLFMLALGTWLAATSLENALRQVHQRAEELDRRVMDRTRDLTETLQREHAEAATTQAILTSVGDGVIVFDHTWRAVVVNPAACSIIERHEGDVLGKNVIRIMGDAVSPDDQAVICSLIDGKGSMHATLKIVWGNKTVSLSFAPIKLPSTNRRGTVVALRDVTREAEVDQMKSEFVSIVSHELRTPMTAIKGYVDLLSTGSAGDVTEMQRNFLSIIKTNTDRLSEMVAELLDLSHIEAGKMQMHYEPVTVGQVIRDVAAMLQKGFDDRGIHLRLDIPDALPEVLSDPGRVAQIITNLLANALKYTFEGRVDVTARLVGNYVQVDVTDTGIGM
ncbi:MAG: multi-sensor signal transduction histidine kinase, partial [Chloroflexi bacterium]|nr:multi-sensor signal transduction histidine kinase [Chloroflexota bacterium]